MYRSFISWRYLFARRTNLIGMVGILVAVAALILILSIMTGFLDESRDRVRGSLADVLIQPYQMTSAEVPTEADLLLEAVRADPRVEAAAAQLVWGGIVSQRDGSIQNARTLSNRLGQNLLAVQMIGVDVEDEFTVSEFRESIEDAKNLVPVEDPTDPFARPRGYDPPGRPKASVIIGNQLLESLHLRLGDELQLATVVFDREVGDWRTNNREFVIAGTFRSGDNETDRGLVYFDRRELADFLGDSKQYTQVLLKLRDYERDADALVVELRESLTEKRLIHGNDGAARIEVMTWESFRGNILGAIENERVLMGIMLSLVLVVAGFTIFAILSMMVTEKRRDIGILRALGATPRGILHVFLLIAFWDALLGATLGAILGTWAAIRIDEIEQALSRFFGVQIFDRSVYLFDHIPAIVQPMSVAAIVLGAFVCALLFAAIPAWRAARLDPMEALRYE